MTGTIPAMGESDETDVTLLVTLRLEGGGTAAGAARALRAHKAAFDLDGGRRAEIIEVRESAPSGWAPAVHAMPALRIGDRFDVGRPASFGDHPDGVRVVAPGATAGQVNAMIAASGDLLLIRPAQGTSR